MRHPLFNNLKHRITGFLLRPGKKIRTVAGSLSESLQNLETALAAVEPRFLDLGRSFAEIHRETITFSDNIAQTIGIAGEGDDKKGLAGVRRYAGKCTRQLKYNQTAMITNLEVFKVVNSHLESLVRHCDVADKVLLLLKVVSLNIGIECNRSAESSGMFGVFVTEIKELGSNVESVTRSLRENAERIHNDHEKTLAEIVAHTNRLTRLADEADGEMSESIRQIEALIERTLRALDIFRESGRAMTTHLSDIVVSLQAHDMFRQKIELGLKKIREVENLIETRLPGLGSVGLKDLAGSALTMLREPIDLLSESTQDIDRMYREILTAFKGIEDKTTSMISVLTGMTEQVNDTSMDHLFSRLATSLSSLDTLIDESESLKRIVDLRIAESPEKTKELSSHVQEVERIGIELRRKALNAIVKAAQLGDRGEAINVFAMEVGNVADTSSRFADNVVTVISEIERAGRSLGHQSDTSGAVANRLSLFVEGLTAAYTLFKTRTHSIIEQFETVRNNIDNTRNSLVFIQEFSKLVSSHTHIAQTLFTDLCRLAEVEIIPLQIPADHSGPLGTLTDATDLVKFLPDQSPSDELPSNDKTKDDPMGDNVELF